jgi:hypothetical protein
VIRSRVSRTACAFATVASYSTKTSTFGFKLWRSRCWRSMSSVGDPRLIPSPQMQTQATPSRLANLDPAIHGARQAPRRLPIDPLQMQRAVIYWTTTGRRMARPCHILDRHTLALRRPAFQPTGGMPLLICCRWRQRRVLEQPKIAGATAPRGKPRPLPKSCRCTIQAYIPRALYCPIIASA